MLNLKERRAPFLHHGASARGMAVDRLLVCVLLLILPSVRYGWRPVLLTLAAALTAALTEILFCLFLRREIRITDLDSIWIGAMIALLMPVNAPFYLSAFGAFFAVGVAKMPFGGTGHAPLEPIAAGAAFATLCFPTQMFTYCSPSAGNLSLNIFKAAEAVTAKSPAALLRSGSRPRLLISELFTGNIAGPMGTTVILMVVAAALFLFFRQTARWEITAGFLASAAVVAVLFPRYSTGIADIVIAELSAGSLAFCAAFLAANPSIAPKLTASRWIYGILGGIFVMIFRHVGVYEQNGVFAILLLNPLAEPLDRMIWKLRERGAALRGRKAKALR